MPVVPLHGWLPDAHSQAPTAGSVDLAGILLKTAAYGRCVSPAAVPERVGRVCANRHVAGVIGIFYGAWMAFAQTDIKRLIAHTLGFPHGLRADCYLHRQPVGLTRAR